eukprot:588797-Amphidinium_carterae.1
MSKRAVSNSNVASKRSKLSRELDVLDSKEDALEFQRDVQWVVGELKKNPDRMKTVKNVVKLKEKSVKFDKSVSFNPDLEGRQLSRIPLKHLKDSFMAELGFTCQEAQALCKVDSKALHKLLYRLCIVDECDPLGPLSISEWNQ